VMRQGEVVMRENIVMVKGYSRCHCPCCGGPARCETTSQPLRCTAIPSNQIWQTDIQTNSVGVSNKIGSGGGMRKKWQQRDNANRRAVLKASLQSNSTAAKTLQREGWEFDFTGRGAKGGWGASVGVGVAARDTSFSIFFHLFSFFSINFHFHRRRSRRRRVMCACVRCSVACLLLLAVLPCNACCAFACAWCATRHTSHVHTALHVVRDTMSSGSSTLFLRLFCSNRCLVASFAAAAALPARSPAVTLV